MITRSLGRYGGFNRTILECKVVPGKLTSLVAIDLIEPYWNVKLIGASCGSICTSGFNRTILECKGKLMVVKQNTVTDLIEPYWNVKV